MIFLGVGLSILPLTSPDEGRNACAAWGMLSSGHFLTPMYNGKLRLIKPPLLYYSMLPFIKIFGPGALAARLPSFLAALAIGVVIFWYGENRLSKGTGWWAMLIWCTNLHVFIEARSAVPEMTLVLWQFLSFLLLIEGTGLIRPHINKKKTVLAWVSAALAVMAKGPIGFLLPALAAMLCALWLKGRRELIPFIGRAWKNIGPLLFSLIVLPWYSIMFYRYGRFFFQEFFYKNNIARFTGSIAYHPYSFWSVYFPILIIGFWLWHPLWGKTLKGLLNKKSPVVNVLKAMFVWSATIIIFYGMAANKLHHYILASYPGLCLLIGWAAATATEVSLGSKLTLAIQGIVEIGAACFLWRYVPSSLPFSLKPLAVIMTIAGIFTFLALSRACIEKGPLSPWLQIFRAGAFLSVLVVGAYLYSGVYQPQVAGRYLSATPSAFYRHRRSAVVFYAQKTIPTLRNATEVAVVLSKEKILRLWLRSRRSASLLAGLPQSVRHKVLWEGYDIGDRVEVIELRLGEN